MNPNRDNEEITEVAWLKKKKSSVKTLRTSLKKKPKLRLASSSVIARQDICRIVDSYNFDALHDRIMKAIEK